MGRTPTTLGELDQCGHDSDRCRPFCAKYALLWHWLHVDQYFTCQNLRPLVTSKMLTGRQFNPRPRAEPRNMQVRSRNQLLSPTSARKFGPFTEQAPQTDARTGTPETDAFRMKAKGEKPTHCCATALAKAWREPRAGTVLRRWRDVAHACLMTAHGSRRLSCRTIAPTRTSQQRLETGRCFAVGPSWLGTGQNRYNFGTLLPAFDQI